MNFKKPKQEVIDNATNFAYGAVNRKLSELKYNYGNHSGQSNISFIEQAIVDGIRAAIESVVKDTYTDEEFEKDLTLRS